MLGSPLLPHSPDSSGYGVVLPPYSNKWLTPHAAGWIPALKAKPGEQSDIFFGGGEGVEGGTAFPWFLEPGFIIQPDICPLSYLLWKLSPSPTGCMGVSWPVSSLTSEILCLISSFLPFLSLAFFFFLVQCVGFIKMLPTGLSPNAHKFLFLPEAAGEIAPLSTRHLINNETNSLVCFLSQSFVLSHAV